MFNFVSETHLRTFVKTVGYRILSILITMAVTSFFGDASTMAAMGVAAFIFGTASYYLHDRAWLLTGWNRDDQGVDSNKRSIVKTIVYRIIVLIMTFFIAKFVLTGSSNQTAATFAVVMLVVNAVVYFLFEKLCNYISWGKYIKQPKEVEENV
jgi:uncharacterized membrane protein